MSAHAFPARRESLPGDVIRWVFGVATVVTNKGKAMFADRISTAKATYTHAPNFLALGIGAEEAGGRTAVAADTALTNEKETRTEGTETIETTSVTKDTYQVKGTQTATAERKVNEAGLFDASSTGNMFTSATLNVVTLLSGDSVTWTWKVQQS